MPPPRVKACHDSTYILEFDEVESTQVELRSRRQSGEIGLIGVRADFQRNGYGRRGSSWHAPRGCSLLISYLDPVEPAQSEATGMLALCGGIAVAEATCQVTGLQPGLRWPNDVVVADRKLAGVLAETFTVRDRGCAPTTMAAIGIGVNVNVAAWPGPLARVATSLLEQTGRPWDISTLESAIRRALHRQLSELARACPGKTVERWRSLDVSAGGAYRFDHEGGSHVGAACGIADDGRLIVRTPAGSEVAVLSATHVQWPAPGEREDQPPIQRPPHTR